MDTVLKAPRPPKRRTVTPTLSASASATVSTCSACCAASITVAKLVGASASFSVTRGAVTTTGSSASSAARATLQRARLTAAVPAIAVQFPVVTRNVRSWSSPRVSALAGAGDRRAAE